MNRALYLTSTTLALLLVLQLLFVSTALAGPRAPRLPSEPTAPTAPASPEVPDLPRAGELPDEPDTPEADNSAYDYLCELLEDNRSRQPLICDDIVEEPGDEDSDDDGEDGEEGNENDGDDGDGNDGEDGGDGNTGEDGDDNNDGQDGQDGSEGGDGEDGGDGSDGQDGDDTTTGDETETETDGNASTTLDHLIITEVLYDLANDGSQGSEVGGDNEWVEIYNPTGAPVDLMGWSIGDGVSNDVISADSKVLAAGDYLIITDALTTDNFWNFGGTEVVHLGSSISGGLSNSGDSVILFDASDVAVDGVSYGDSDTAFSPSVSTVDPGSSITRTSLIVDSDLAIDWIEDIFPSPGS